MIYAIMLNTCVMLDLYSMLVSYGQVRTLLIRDPETTTMEPPLVRTPVMIKGATDGSATQEHIARMHFGTP